MCPDDGSGSARSTNTAPTGRLAGNWRVFLAVQPLQHGWMAG